MISYSRKKKKHLELNQQRKRPFHQEQQQQYQDNQNIIKQPKITTTSQLTKQHKSKSYNNTKR